MHSPHKHTNTKEKMDSIHIVDDDNTYGVSDDRSWLKLDSDVRPNHSVGGDERTTIEIVQQFLNELIESVEMSCAKYGGSCKSSCHQPDESEYAVEGMLSLTNPIHLAPFSPSVHVSSQEDLEEFAARERVHDAVKLEPEEKDKWDASAD